MLNIEHIYAEGKDGSLYVNLFIPSILNWKTKNALIEQSTGFPEDNKTTITVKSKKHQQFTIHIRYPWWGKKVRLL